MSAALTVATLAEAHLHARTIGTKFALVADTEPTTTTLPAANVADLLTPHPTVEAAITSLQGHNA